MNPFGVSFWMSPRDDREDRLQEAADDADDALGTVDPCEATDPALHARICARRYASMRRGQRYVEAQVRSLQRHTEATSNRGMFVMLAAFGMLLFTTVASNPAAAGFLGRVARWIIGL